MITVCDNCMRSCCWQGFFMCEGAETAGTVEMRIRDLAELGLEHPSYLYGN